MSAEITVLIVDDIDDTRDHIAKLLSFESDLRVVGTAMSGEEAVEMAEELRPDVVLMDVNLGEGIDGFETTERITRSTPEAGVVMISVQGDAEYLRRSMLAGARGFLVKPFSSEELVSSMRAVHARKSEQAVRLVPVGPGPASRGGRERNGKIVAVFAPSGGAGRTTIAVNLAAHAASALKLEVALVDASLEFGDVGLHLNLNPAKASLADALPELAAGGPEGIDDSLVEHSTGLRVLLAPPTPETAELVSADNMRTIVQHLRRRHDLVVVDCWSALREPALTILDIADTVLLVLTRELTSVKNMRVLLTVAEKLGYSKDKLQLVLNRSDVAQEISIADVERSIGRKISHNVVSDSRTVAYAVNRGAPFVIINPRSKISRDIARLASAVAAPVADPEEEALVAPAPRRRRLLAGRVSGRTA